MRLNIPLLTHITHSKAGHESPVNLFELHLVCVFSWAVLFVSISQVIGSEDASEKT